MQKRKSGAGIKFSTNSKEFPASQGMLKLVRTELKSDIRGLRSETKSGFNQMDSKIEQVLSEVARVSVMIEEQNSRNQVVLEGLTSLYQRQDRSDLRTEEVHHLVQGLAARSRR